MSKYDPAFRNGGVFKKADWTSHADIGKAFEGHMLTLEDYLRVEKRYIQFIFDVVNACKGNKLRLVYSACRKTLSTRWETVEKVRKTSSSRLTAYMGTVRRELCSKSKIKINNTI